MSAREDEHGTGLGPDWEDFASCAKPGFQDVFSFQDLPGGSSMWSTSSNPRGQHPPGQFCESPSEPRIARSPRPPLPPSSEAEGGAQGVGGGSKGWYLDLPVRVDRVEKQIEKVEESFGIWRE